MTEIDKTQQHQAPDSKQPRKRAPRKPAKKKKAPQRERKFTITDVTPNFLDEYPPDEVQRAFRELPYRRLPGDLPPRVTHVIADGRDIMISDIGTGPECVGFALADVINRVRSQLGSEENSVSPYMVYALAKRYDKWPGEEYTGTSARAGIIALDTHGVCNFDMWPEPAEPTDIPNSVYEAALDNRPVLVRRVPIDSASRRINVQAAVAENDAVLVSLTLHSGWHSPSGGIIPFEEGSGEIGGHALAIIGYTEQGFIV